MTKIKTKQSSLFDYYGFTERDAKKYPVISRILKQLTPERIKKEIEAIRKVELPSELQKWVREYEKVGERNEFIWRLFLKAKQEISCVSTIKICQNSLEEVKFLITMFVILLDDVADKTRQKTVLNELLKIPCVEKNIRFNKLKQEEKRYLGFTIKIWRRINLLIQKYPGYKEFKEIFKYDVKQIINAINYDYLINTNYSLINKTEYWLHSPYPMQILVPINIDLMCLYRFDTNELGVIREITWEAQKMARMGNCINTWEKELKENDFTSGVFAYAIDSKNLTAQGLINMENSQIIKKVKEAAAENKLLKEWEKCYRKIFSFKGRIKTINIQKLLEGLEKLLILEIISKKDR